MPTKQLPRDALGRERRVVTIDERSIERRAAGEPIGFKGHALVFGQRTWIGPKRWGFWEQIAPGATAKSIIGDDIRMLFNHDPNFVLARNTAGSLRLSEDAKGLNTDADMKPTSYAQDLAILLDGGEVNQMSFGFETLSDTWETLDDGNELRTLNEVKLWDVSPVTYPAYVSTDASLRSVAFSKLCDTLGIDGDEQSALVRAVAQGTAARTNKAKRHMRSLRGALDALNDGQLLTEPHRAALLEALRADGIGGGDDVDPDDDIAATAGALDATLDEALEAFSEGTTDDPDIQQGIALVQAAEIVVDQLLELLGVADPDDADDDLMAGALGGGGMNSAKPESTRTETGSAGTARYRRYAQSKVAAMAHTIDA